MEINASVYAVAENRKLLLQVNDILSRKTYAGWVGVEVMEPCAVLPLTKTWYGFTKDSGMTDEPDGWLGCLRECAQILKKNGAVVVEFRSPDHPDDYLEYAYTTSRGEAGQGKRPALFAYDRALGNRDISLAIDELFSGRSAQERAYACRRKEKKEALRKAEGDFRITGDGVLTKYLGDDTNVVIPDGVREIGESAFVDMKGVERMIMECEDYDAPAMKTLVIPDSVEKIGSYAFAYCLNLTGVEMPDSIRVIGDRAFEGCESLEKIRLSAGLTAIEEYTFFLCGSLKSITIPEGVTRIGEAAFMDCYSLKKAVLPESLRSIGAQAFKGSGLKKVRIPENVKEIGKDTV